MAIHKRQQNQISINMYGFIFIKFKELESWVVRMSVGQDYIQVWENLILQLRQLSDGTSSFFEKVVRVIQNDQFFATRH